MEEVPYNPLIIVTKEEMKGVRKEFNIDAKRINEAVDILIEWYKQQDHLQGKKLEREFMERMYVLARGSVEGTKSKIDKFCTIRGLMPELLRNRTVEEFDTLLTVTRYTPLPKLSSDFSRIIVSRFLPDKIDVLNMTSYFRFCFLLGDYRMNCDYSLGDTFIVDLKNVPISIITKINPITLKKSEIICHDGYACKIRGIHIINAPSYVDKLVTVLKQGFREKVAKRIHVHKSFEELHKFISKDILPKDYDGMERSLEKLEAEWVEEINTKKARSIIAEFDEMVSDEAKRQTIKFNEEYLGMPGTFRKLNVD